MVNNYSLIVHQLLTGGIAGSALLEILVINTAGISTATGNYVQVTGITTGTDSYHRITAVNNKTISCC